MKALIIHPFLGSHYKAIIFSHLEKIAQEKLSHKLFVIQMFENESSRTGMTSEVENLHNYPYSTLFNSDHEKPSFFKKFSTLKRVIKAENPDIINVTGYYDWAVNLIMIYAKLSGIRIAMSIDSTLMDRHNSFLKRVVKSFLLFWPDTFFCYGSKSVELIKFFGRSAKDVSIAKNAVPNKLLLQFQTNFKNAAGYNHWRSQFPNRNFVFVGRLIPEKNVELLIKAFETLKLPDWGLIIIGTGELENNLKELAKSQSIYFEGGKSWTQIPHYFSASDVLVLPSSSEPWGLVVNEAMSCGLPAITSDSCGSAYDLILNKKTGLIFPNNNQEELIKAMKMLSQNELLRNEMGKNAQEVIKSYDPELLAREMWEGFIKFA